MNKHIVKRWIIQFVAMFIMACEGSASPIKVVLLSGLNNHNWEKTTPVLKQMLERTGSFDVDISENPEDLTKEDLAKYDVIVSNWNSWPRKEVEKEWSPELRRAYLDFVRGGKGHVAVHAGSSSFYDWPAMQRLYGVTWEKGKTGHGRVHIFPVRMTKVDHPISDGVSGFEIRDELWRRPELQPDVKVLAESFSSRSNGGTGEWEPCLVAQSFGKGRSATLLLGHDTTAMQNPGFQKLLLRAAEWCATGEVR